METDRAEKTRRRLVFLHTTFVLGSGLLIGSLTAWGGYTTAPYGLIPALCLGAFCGFLGVIGTHFAIMSVIQFIGLIIILRHSRNRD